MKKQRSGLSAEQHRRIKDRMIINVGCRRSILEENVWIAYSISLLDALISLGGIDKWMTVRMAIDNHLTDELERKRIIENANPASQLYENPEAIDHLINNLNFCSGEKEQLISKNSTLAETLHILSIRRDENNHLLSS